MARTKKLTLGCFGTIGVVLTVVAALVLVNREAVFRRFAEVVKVQSDKSQATLFRLGEVLSIRAELKSEYGTDPLVTYSTGPRGRVLRIDMGAHLLPEGATARDRARVIAGFAVARTKKHDAIDAVEVLLETSSTALETFTFPVDELLSDTFGRP